MSSLLVGLLTAMAATNQVEAVSNVVSQSTGIAVSVPGSTDPVEQEFQKLMEDDQTAEDEADGWIKENRAFVAKGAGVPPAEMNQRILKRLAPIRERYEKFIKEHPNHVRARIAYASFLDDLGEEDAEVDQLEKARELDPKDPAIWNNLANYYGHNGPITNAFIYYEKAISLDSNEPVYYQNLGTTVYLFRKDAEEHYHINEQQVFNKALMLYSNATRLDPTNFELASDMLAQTYYGIRPVRTDEALGAWTNALHLARNEAQREGVYVHMARFEYKAGRFQAARDHLNAVTNAQYSELKAHLLRNVAEAERDASTNTAKPPAK